MSKDEEVTEQTTGSAGARRTSFIPPKKVAKFPCVTSTVFGRPVDPEVNRLYITASASSWMDSASAGDSVSLSLVRSTMIALADRGRADAALAVARIAAGC